MDALLINVVVGIANNSFTLSCKCCFQRIKTLSSYPSIHSFIHSAIRPSIHPSDQSSICSMFTYMGLCCTRTKQDGKKGSYLLLSEQKLFLSNNVLKYIIFLPEKHIFLSEQNISTPGCLAFIVHKINLLFDCVSLCLRFFRAVSAQAVHVKYEQQQSNSLYERFIMCTILYNNKVSHGMNANSVSIYENHGNSLDQKSILF